MYKSEITWCNLVFKNSIVKYVKEALKNIKCHLKCINISFTLTEVYY